MTYKIIGNKLLMEVDKDIYTEAVLHKCFYWYGAEYTVELSLKDDKALIAVEPKRANTAIVDLNELAEKINSDLIDFKLRDIVTKETEHVRNLLVAKAFAHYDTDEDPLTDVSDPVGFNP